VLRRKSPQRLTFTSIVLTTLSCSASGIFAIFCDLTLPTIARLAHTFQSTRTRRCREQYMPLVTFCPRHFLADSIICMYVFDFRQAWCRFVPTRTFRNGSPSIRKQYTSGSSESPLGDTLGSARGFDGDLQRCRTLTGKWSSFKQLSELIGDTTAQSGCR
jgi:hypothetical protein